MTDDPRSGVPLKSMSATIRATQDIWCRRNSDDDDDDGGGGAGVITYQLFPSSALHLLDHHWHTSGLIPHVYSVSNQTSVIYENDWICTFQSVTCFPQEGLIELTVEDGSNGSAQTHAWIDRVGASTLYVSHMITLYDQVLATAVRILRRRQAIPTEVLTTNPGRTDDARHPHPHDPHPPSNHHPIRRHTKIAAPFTNDERHYFQYDCAADDVILDFQVQLEERLQRAKVEQEEMRAEDQNENDNDNEKGLTQTNAIVGRLHLDHGRLVEPSPEHAMLNGDDDGRRPEENKDAMISGKTKPVEDNGTETGMSSISGSSTATTSPGSSSKITKKHSTESPQRRVPSSNRKMTLSNTLSLETFGTFLPCLHGNYLLTVRVGPQHLDYVSGGDGQLADTTWLAEVAFQALVEGQLLGPIPTDEVAYRTDAGTSPTRNNGIPDESSPMRRTTTSSSSHPTNRIAKGNGRRSGSRSRGSGGSKSSSSSSTCSMAIQYLSFAILGNQLHCSLHGNNRVCVVRAAMTEWGEKEGDQVLVLVAKAGPLP